MWIYDKNGFVSIVADKDSDDLLIRARFSGDIERVCGLPKKAVKKTPDADYMFRARVERGALAGIIADRIERIDYPNFKDSTPLDRHPIYLKIWQIMFNEQWVRLPARLKRPFQKTKRKLSLFP